jgi:hypothetical protein
VTCHNPSAECSFVIDGVTIRSPDSGSGSIEITSKAGNGLSRAAHVRGEIVNSYVHSALCRDLGLLRIGPLGATQDSSILVMGNTFVCENVTTPGLLGGNSLVVVQGGLGTTRLIDNQFFASFMGNACSLSSCAIAAFRDSASGVDPSDVFIQNNSVSFGIYSSGMASSTLAFIDLGSSGQVVQNSRWHMSGNEFRVDVRSGDFNTANTKDVRLRDFADSNTIFTRDQEFRYGVQVDAGSTSSVSAWPTALATVDFANVDSLLIPTARPTGSSPADGHLWVDSSKNEICYRSRGKDFCAKGTAP